LKEKLFYDYIEAWVKKDIDGFLTTLSEDIFITECYGPQYKGKRECEIWFSHWTTPSDNLVKSWIVTGSYFDGNNGFFRWTFEYVYKGKAGIFDGISLVKFSGAQISEIWEFEMKHEKFRPYQRNETLKSKATENK
jgi:hypothetical protein